MVCTTILSSSFEFINYFMGSNEEISNAVQLPSGVFFYPGAAMPTHLWKRRLP